MGEAERDAGTELREWVKKRVARAMAAIPKLDEANLQAISDILGATDTWLTGKGHQGRRLRFLGLCIAWYGQYEETKY